MTYNFPLNEFKYPPDIEKIISDCWAALGSWRRFLIVVDGRDGVGKSVFARYLAYRLNMTLFEADSFLLGNGSITHKDFLGEILQKRLERGKYGSPLILDSIFAVDVCAKFSLVPDYVIRVARVGCRGSEEWQDRFSSYEALYNNPDAKLVLPCEPAKPDCRQFGSVARLHCVGCPEVCWDEAQDKPWDQ